MCEQLAEDYAKRASVLSLSFEDGYNKYIKRLKKRTDDEILEQFTVANLTNLPKKRPQRVEEEYIITTNDDDCEDGVCKL
tara:strand:+ start:308 stop:547 length:240 start_codon:yes stop_codon:yes gene_type:complete